MTAIALHTHTHSFPILSPASAPIDYIETTVPAGITLADYRRSLPRRARRWQRLKELAGGPAR